MKHLILPAPEKVAQTACRERLEQLTKPAASLGELEELAIQMAGITGQSCPDKWPVQVYLTEILSEEDQERLALFQTAETVGMDLLPIQTGSPEQCWCQGQAAAEAITKEVCVVAIGGKSATAKDWEGLPEYWRQMRAGRAVAARKAFFDGRSLEEQTQAVWIGGFLLHAAARRCGLVLTGKAAAFGLLWLLPQYPAITDFLLCAGEEKNNPLWSRLGVRQPLLLEMTGLPGLEAILALQVLALARKMLTEMRTFSETQVSTACDRIREDDDRNRG